MRTEDRKMAVNAYKKREVEGGIYAVRCVASGEVWVGGSPDLSKIQNRLWFTLRQGMNTHRSLQIAWNAMEQRRSASRSSSGWMLKRLDTSATE